MNLWKDLEKAVNELDASRVRILRTFIEIARDTLERDIMNLKCDLSATAEEHHIGTKHGHKQARHHAVERILEVFNQLLSLEDLQEPK